MKNISILPSEYKKDNKAYRGISAIILIGVIFTMLFASAFVAFYISNSALQQRLKSLEGENSLLASRVEELKPYLEAYNKIEAVSALAREAAGSNPEWRGLMNDISENIPQNVWLGGIACTYDGKAAKVELKGYARDYNGVAEWIRQLKGIKGLADISCSLSASQGSGSGRSVQFEISAAVSRVQKWSLPAEEEFER
ncbi:Tfp pilus assembly protein PilN [Anaerobacterium chartisolvens]|uniref:Tfp pilus assembly protein PilN n=1 Tax=Anaerobacterium chartisolvens TaxID=1297424 RepID=A0A369B039_9FIRM|nr:PilN domain-containing protein [Anaerobacterium chartisolvens]RCX13797.1 Tfp pilus assembly protein PilN [Anaerobacterium chartisolvens]